MKTVFITGASRGIGKAIAHQFAANGYYLYLNCNTSLEELYTTEQELNQLYPNCCTTVPGDVSNPQKVEQIFNHIKTSGHGPDVLVNNAGIAHIGLLTDLTIEQWQNVISTNLSSAFYCSRHAIPSMVHTKKGTIINISSMWGTVGASCEVAYSAAKAGLHGFTKALAKELAPSNITVNAIACGVIDTAMNNCLSSQDRFDLEQEIPAGRFGTAEEVAKLTFSIATSPSYMTGQIIGIDGGFI